ncbi:MAG TPA: glycosyl hydrolase [Geminicoccaceae bacterium]|nr:glycosyl hydrolase [Geminicoccus sp.]HMU48346.1 glycosyl hydrolase [Geminicoccaceae bacterium]
MRAAARKPVHRSPLLRRFLGVSVLLGAAAMASGEVLAAAAADETRATPAPISLIGAVGAAAAPSPFGALPLTLPGESRSAAPILLASHQNNGGGGGSSSGNQSGLSWKSGSQCYSEQFENYRGRKVDVNSLFLGRTSWNGVLGNLRGSNVERAADRPGQIAVALAMLMKGESFKDCNNGKLDSTFKDIGKALSRGNMDGTIVRLGWEANGTSYVWSIRDQVEPYKQCFKRLVGILRKEAPKILIEWSMRKDNGASAGVHQLYPGNDVVDYIGTSLYDRYPSSNNQQQWDENYRLTKQGGPKGLGTWLEFAKSKGKKVSLSEWAISNTYPSSSKDNPFYVEKVFQFLKSNASNIGYEAYFNCVGVDARRYLLLPESRNPKTSAKYRELWRKGA